MPSRHPENEFDRAFVLLSIPFAAALGGILGRALPDYTVESVLLFMGYTIGSALFVFYAGSAFRMIARDEVEKIHRAQIILIILPGYLFVELVQNRLSVEWTELTVLAALLLAWGIVSMVLAFHFKNRAMK